MVEVLTVIYSHRLTGMEKSSDDLNGVSHGDTEAFPDGWVQLHDNFGTFSPTSRRRNLRKRLNFEQVMNQRFCGRTKPKNDSNQAAEDYEVNAKLITRFQPSYLNKNSPVKNIMLHAGISTIPWGPA